jgi:chromate transport protein ChrA
MTGMRKAALAAITLLVAAASFTSFAESYRALLDWATRHGLHGIWALAWPLQVDTFIAVGELALFVALADRWAVRSRAAAWTVTAAGLIVSVAGNVGHAGTNDWVGRATAAVPPLAAAAALAVGLGVLKRVVAARAMPEPDAGTLALTQTAPTDSVHAAQLALVASIAAGNPIS